MKSLTLQIASLPDRDFVVSEIWFGNDQVAEVFSEDGKSIHIELFPARDGGVWSFDLDAFQAILTKARSSLLNT